MSKKDKLTLNEKKQLQAKKRMRQTIIGAVALVAVIAIVIGGMLINRYTGISLHSATGATTANRKMDKAMATYYFNEYLSDYVNERIYYIEAGYLNLNLKKDLKDQTYDGENTWYSYFAENAKENLRRDMLLCELAAKDGVTLSEDDKTAITEKLATIKPADCGTGLTEEDVRLCLEQQALADKYLEQKNPDLYGTEADWDKHYKDNVKTYISVDYLYVDIVPNIGSSEEQTAYDALLNKAMSSRDPKVFKETVKTILVNHADVDEASAAVQVEDMLQSNQTQLDDNELSSWMFEDDTKLYDTFIDETTSSCKLYMMMRLKGQDKADTVTYRNILIPTADDAKATADDLLAQWKAGKASPESFSELAMSYSKDTTSLKTNGVYENVFNGRMGTVVNGWLFDETRQPGDTAVLETSDGYQVVYYEGIGIQRWQIRVRNDLYKQRYEKLLNDAEKTYKLKINDGTLDSINPKINYEK